MPLNGKRKARSSCATGSRGCPTLWLHLSRSSFRCHWHVPNDVKYAMWKDKAPLNERKVRQSRIAGLIGIELPEEDFEKVKEEDKTALFEKTKEGLRRNLRNS